MGYPFDPKYDAILRQFVNDRIKEWWNSVTTYARLEGCSFEEAAAMLLPLEREPIPPAPDPSGTSGIAT